MARVHSNKKSKQSRNHNKNTAKARGRNINRMRAQAARIGVAEAKPNEHTIGLTHTTKRAVPSSDVYQPAIANALNALQALFFLPFQSLRIWQGAWFPTER